MIEAKIFSHKIKELDQRFSFIMIHYIDYYIKNGISYDNNNEYYQEYMRLITNLEKLSSELFKLNNQLDKKIQSLNKNIQNSKKNIKKQTMHANSHTNSHTNMANLLDSKNALEKMQTDTLLAYSKTNIIVLNYLLGIIFGIYILRNL